MKRYAISDIHGCHQTFRALLERINFSTADELYLLGDYIDRGPASKGVIDTIWELQASGHQVYCLRGNHEQMLLGELDLPHWSYAGEAATLQSFGATKNEEIPAAYIDWMKNLPFHLETEGYLFVHAGMNTQASDPYEDKEFMLWQRHWYEGIDRDWLGDRIIVHGHTPISETQIRAQVANVNRVPALNIDNGCVFPGAELHQLCALELNERRLYFQPYIDQLTTEQAQKTQALEQLAFRPPPPLKVWYFAIDGTLYQADGRPKPQLLNGALEWVVKAADFDFLACIGHQCDEATQFDRLDERKDFLYTYLAPFFADREWLLDKLLLVYDHTNRAKYLDLSIDWYYTDAGADAHLQQEGLSSPSEQEASRIFIADPQGDGQALLDFLSA